jgi:general secretion pathway protein D
VRRRRPAIAAVLAALAALVLLAACGGGGGGGPTQPPPPSSSLTFTPGGTAGGNVILLARTGPTGGSELHLAVEAREVNDLYGAAFDLGFPAAVLDFEGATVGELLSRDGFQVSLQVAEETGNLIVGVSRLGAVPGVSGTGTLVTLRFRAIASGSGSLTFSRTQAVDADGRPVGGLAFVGGSVQSTL